MGYLILIFSLGIPSATLRFRLDTGLDSLITLIILGVGFLGTTNNLFPPPILGVLALPGIWYFGAGNFYII